MKVTISHASQRVASVSRPSRNLCCRAGTGFGKTPNKQNNSKLVDSGSGVYTAPRTKKRVNLVEELGLKNNSVSAAGGSDPDRDLTKGNWFELANVSDFAGDKKRKVSELKGSKKTVVLHLYKDTIYAMEAFSTAYQYPLIDGKLADGPEGEPTIETPLDGTVYELKTGKVLKWCPADGSPIRGLLRTLKASVPPVPLPVYPVVVQQDGRVMVRMSV